MVTCNTMYCCFREVEPVSLEEYMTWLKEKKIDTDEYLGQSFLFFFFFFFFLHLLKQAVSDGPASFAATLVFLSISEYRDQTWFFMH